MLKLWQYSPVSSQFRLVRAGLPLVVFMVHWVMAMLCKAPLRQLAQRAGTHKTKQKMELTCDPGFIWQMTILSVQMVQRRPPSLTFQVGIRIAGHIWIKLQWKSRVRYLSHELSGGEIDVGLEVGA